MNVQATLGFLPPRLTLPAIFGSDAKASPLLPPWGFDLNLAETAATWFSSLITPTAAAAITGGTFTAASDLYTKTGHGLYTGDAVVLTSFSGGTTNVVAATTYYFIRVSSSTGYLASSQANALAGTHIDLATADGTAVVLTPVEARVIFRPDTGVSSGGADSAGINGTAAPHSDAVGYYYLFLQEEIIDPTLPTSDHTLFLRDVDATNGILTRLGSSTHKSATPTPAHIECKYPLPLACGTSGATLMIGSSSITNVRYRLFGILGR